VDAEHHWAIITGLIIGLLAKLVVPGRQAIPVWLTILLGIVGALIGNWLATLLGVRVTGGIDWIRHIPQIGAVLHQRDGHRDHQHGKPVEHRPSPRRATTTGDGEPD
jgi:uncharacterized membrane protein YeaQ/YmgE (transglycosylase-associated protein family)